MNSDTQQPSFLDLSVETLNEKNLPLFQHAYEEIVLNYTDLKNNYDKQQTRTLETCKWIGAFYTAGFATLKPDLSIHWYLWLPLLAIPYILYGLWLKGYAPTNHHPLGHKPYDILNDALILNEGLESDKPFYYTELGRRYQIRIQKMEALLETLAQDYKTTILWIGSILTLTFILFLYSLWVPDLIRYAQAP
ncbi:MAG: hypothetical protein ACKO37_05030 [Vampirovibrionales bacterium]